MKQWLEKDKRNIVAFLRAVDLDFTDYAADRIEQLESELTRERQRAERAEAEVERLSHAWLVTETILPNGELGGDVREIIRRMVSAEYNVRVLLDKLIYISADPRQDAEAKDAEGEKG